MTKPSFAAGDISQPLVLFLVGPTAVGKSALALELARSLNGEIVSCDAMQVYREINIASDKPSFDMQQVVPHHLIDVVSVTETFSVARYRTLAMAAIDDILRRGKLPVVCGGSGMYMSVLLDGIFEEGEVPSEVRNRLKAMAKRDGLEGLFRRLQAVDPDASERIRPGDTQRILRALEVFESRGETISALQKKRKGMWEQYHIRVFALNRSRAELYARVEARIDEMFERGIVEEVRSVLQIAPADTAAKLIGLPEVKGYLEGDYDLVRAKYLMKLHTRHYVKRQLTWFRKDPRIAWINVDAAADVPSVALMVREKM